MTVRFVALDAMGELPSGRLDAALQALEEAARDIVPVLEADRVDIVVTPTEYLIPGWDLNGFANGLGRISIGISTKPKLTAESQPASDDVVGRPRGRTLPEQLRSVLAHELHHVMRSRGPGYGKRLGEALVSEGLAQCFEEEVGCPTPNYAVAVRGELLGLAALRARKDWDATGYNHPRWFFGDPQDPAWPWSGGYSLGYVLVRHFLDSGGSTASRDVGVSADEVRRRSIAIFDELMALTSEDAA